MVVDANPQEEACMSGRLYVAVNPSGGVCSMQKGGQGGLHPANLLDLLRRAQHLGVQIAQVLDDALARDSPMDIQQQPFAGFLHS